MSYKFSFTIYVAALCATGTFCQFVQMFDPLTIATVAGGQISHQANRDSFVPMDPVPDRVPAVTDVPTTAAFHLTTASAIIIDSRDAKSIDSESETKVGGDEADAVLRLLRKSKTQITPQPVDLKMGCFTEASDIGSGFGNHGSSQKGAGDGDGVGSASRPSKNNLQMLLMQVVGQVANYNERISQEGDNRRAIVKMLENYIKGQKESLRKSETILNEYQTTLPKYGLDEEGK